MAIPDQWSDIISIGTLNAAWAEMPVVSTTVLRDGWVVATWLDGSGVFKGQILNADGTTYGPAFEIGTTDSQSSASVSVAALPNGRFIVAYNSYDSGTQSHTLIQKTFDIFGGEVDENVLVSSAVFGGLHPSVNVFADGSFDITYNDDGVKFFRYSDNGAVSGTISSSGLNIGKSAVSQNTFANLEYGTSDQKLYVSVSLANGFRIARTAVGDFATFDLAQASDVAVLADGTFAVTYVQNTATSGSLQAKIFTPDGRFLQTIILYESNKPLGLTAVQHLSGSDFAFSVVDGDGGGPLHVGTYQGGWVDQWDMPGTNALHPEIAVLNDGRFLVQWMTATTGGPAQVAIYDPRTAAVDWTGNDIGQQYGGTKFGDQLHAGNGWDTLYGAGGDDGLSGGGGDDVLFGGAGNDAIDAGDGNDLLDGGDGGDRLDGGNGDDTVTYRFLAPQRGGVIVDLSNNNNGGAAAGDVLLNIEAVEGTNQADTLIGVKLANGNGVLLMGMGGNDQLIGKDGVDHLDGGDGDDLLFGGIGSDLLDGGAGTDTASYYGMSSGATVDLSNNANNGGVASGDTLTSIEAVQGTDSNDTLIGVDRGGGQGVELFGMGGNDSLAGGGGGDRLEGGDGNDTLNGSGGNDIMAGGKGNDVYWVDSANDTVFELGDQGTDTVHSSVDFSIAAWAIENVILEGTADLNVTGNVYDNILTGNTGNNRIVAAEGNDTVNGGDGDDTLIGGAGADLLNGDGGTNRASYATSSAGVMVDLGAGIFKYGDAEGDRLVNIQQLEGSKLADTFTAGASGNLISGLAGDDTIMGASGEDVLGGDDGNDVLDGGGAHDVLYGGAGNDIMTGGAGDDYLDGEGGNDTAKYGGSLAGYSIVDNGDGTFTVTGQDGQDTLKGIEFADFNGEIVRLAPGGANLVPIIDGLSNAVVDEDQDPASVIGSFSAHDPEDGATGLLYELKTESGQAADANGLFEVDAMTGELRVKGNLPDVNGSQDFTITLKVSDKNGGAGSAAAYQTFTITVMDVVNGNHAPNQLTLNNGTAVTISENAAFAGTLSAQDADGDTGLTWTFDDTVAGNANGLFDIVDDGNGHKVLKLKAPLDYEALPSGQKYVTVSVKASDGKPGGTSATQAFRINVADVDESINHAPTAITLAGTGADELRSTGTIVGALSATDDDHDALTYTLIDNAGGRFVLSGTTILVADGFKLDYEQARSHTIMVQVSDGRTAVNQAFTITVDDWNPEVTAGSGANDVFYGGTAKDTLAGGAGHDRLFGGAGADSLKGGAGNDTLSGGAGKDTLTGGKWSKADPNKDAFLFDLKLTKGNDKYHVDKVMDAQFKYDALLFDDAAFTNKAIAKYLKGKAASLDKAVAIKKGWFALDHAQDRDDFFIAKKVGAKTYKLYFDGDGSGAGQKALEIATVTYDKKIGGEISYKDFLFV